MQKESRAFPFLLFSFFFPPFPARLCNIAIKLPGKCKGLGCASYWVPRSVKVEEQVHDVEYKL